MVNPLANIYCHGDSPGWSIYRTTRGPKDHNNPAKSTTGIAILSFFNSNIIRYLLVIDLFHNRNELV